MDNVIPAVDWYMALVFSGFCSGFGMPYLIYLGCSPVSAAVFSKSAISVDNFIDLCFICSAFKLPLPGFLLFFSRLAALVISFDMVGSVILHTGIFDISFASSLLKKYRISSVTVTPYSLSISEGFAEFMCCSTRTAWNILLGHCDVFISAMFSRICIFLSACSRFLFWYCFVVFSIQCLVSWVLFASIAVFSFVCSSYNCFILGCFSSFFLLTQVFLLLPDDTDVLWNSTFLELWLKASFPTVYLYDFLYISVKS